MKKLLLFSLLLVAACSLRRTDVGIQPIYCTAGADCDGKMQRAAAWVQANSQYSIKTQTDSVIETDPPSANGPWSAITVTRQPLAHDGLFRIVMASRCDDTFQCDPTGPDLQASFVHDVDPQQNPKWPRQ